MRRNARESRRERMRRIRAEAAVWFARRNGSNWSAKAESGLLHWLAEDPDHAAEFGLAVEVWNNPAQCLRKREPVLLKPRLLATVALIALVAIGAAIFYSDQTALSTRIGERLTRTLSDGTKVQLNTDTHITVHYSARQREILLKSGEIFLDLVKHDRRPFVVVAGAGKVMANTATFVARRDDNSVTPLTVTLSEGCVAILTTRTGGPLSPTGGAAEVTLLNVGERVRFGRDGTRVVDKPPVEQVASWREGKLWFADTPLMDAVNEFNRYGPYQIVVRSPEAASIRVNGLFRIDDAFSFVQTVVRAQNMLFELHGDQIILWSASPSAAAIPSATS